MADLHLMLVLSDGCTYSSLNGASIMGITEADCFDLHNGTREPADLKPVFEIALTEFFPNNTISSSDC